jgi:FkbM family methyltransferase
MGPRRVTLLPFLALFSSVVTWMALYPGDGSRDWWAFLDDDHGGVVIETPISPHRSSSQDLVAFTRGRRLSLSQSTTSGSASQSDPLPVNCLLDYLVPLGHVQQVNHYENGTNTYRSLGNGPSFVDTNQGMLLSRLLNGGALPAFHLSVHHEKADHVRWSVMQYGHYYEKVQDQLFIDILTDAATRENGSPPTLRVVDVGGNIGYFTLRSAAVAASLRVPYELIAFEPNPVNIARFCESLWLNADTFFASSADTTTVDIYQQGVSDKAGILTFSLPTEGNPGTGTFKETGEDPTVPPQNISVTTLDDFARYRDWLPRHDAKPPVDIHVLKIDVEGLEPAVIQGATALLQSGLVWNVIVEISCRTKRDVAPLNKALHSLFRAGFRLQGHGGWSGPNPGVNPWGNGDADTLVQGILDACQGHKVKQLNLWWQHSDHSMKDQKVIP